MHREPAADFQQWVVVPVTLLQGALLAPSLAKRQPFRRDTAIGPTCRRVSRAWCVGQRSFDEAKCVERARNPIQIALNTRNGATLSNSFELLTCQTLKRGRAIPQQQIADTGPEIVAWFLVITPAPQDGCQLRSRSIYRSASKDFTDKRIGLEPLQPGINIGREVEQNRYDKIGRNRRA